MKIIAVTQARIGSSRMPGKVLRTINNRSLLQIHLERILTSEKISKVKVATTQEPDAIAICAIAEHMGIESYRGSTTDVLDRYYQTVKDEQPDYIVRITSDCPLIDAAVIDKVIDFATARRLDYASNNMVATFPDGTDVEVFTFHSLERAWQEATLASDREHVTAYIWRNSSFKGGSLFVSDNLESGGDYGSLRLTVDEPFDFELMERLISELGYHLTWEAYAHYLLEHPEIRSINEHIIRNEGYLKSITRDIQ